MLELITDDCELLDHDVSAWCRADRLIFDDVPLVEYFTFMAVMAAADMYLFT